MRNKYGKKKQKVAKTIMSRGNQDVPAVLSAKVRAMYTAEDRLTNEVRILCRFNSLIVS